MQEPSIQDLESYNELITDLRLLKDTEKNQKGLKIRNKRARAREDQ